MCELAEIVDTSKRTFALDKEAMVTREDEIMKRLSHSGTFDFMHQAGNDNNTIQDVIQSVLQHYDGLGLSLKQ